MDQRPVVLIGLMGVGKTTVGRLVAERTGRAFVDTDEAIEAATGKTVRELWEEGGESAYRELESTVVLDSLSADRRVVLGAAAGSVLDPAVREALCKPGAFVVWLHADPSVLQSRVHPGDHRPLLGGHPGAVLAQMETERASIYGQVADIVVETGGRDPSDIAAEITRLIGEPG